MPARAAPSAPRNATSSCPAMLDLQHRRPRRRGPASRPTPPSTCPTGGSYDAVIAMYHDQALIPIKTVAFDEAVNVTLGLPIVRTSPDHGTAFDLAGTGKALARQHAARAHAAARATAADAPRAAIEPDRQSAAAARGHRAARPQRQKAARPELPARSQPHGADRPRRRGRSTGVTVIEVGPGPGGLTRALLAEGARKVIAIERDERALPALAEIAAAYPGRLEIIAGDALEIDYAALADGPTRIVANLPYNIGTELLIRLADARALAALLREPDADVPARSRRAHRRAARRRRLWPARRARAAGAPKRASPSMSRRSAFTPPPKVTSAVVHLVPKPVDRRCPRAAISKPSPAPPSASAARWCAKASNRPACRSRRCSPPPASRATSAPRTLPVEAFLAMAKVL